MAEPRIVHVLPSLTVGGAEVFVALLAEAQLARGRDVHVVCLTTGGPLEARLSPSLRERLHVVGKRHKFDATVLPRAVALLRRLRPDVAHLHLFTALTWGLVAARLARVPAVVYTEHGCHDEPVPYAPFVRRRTGPRVDVMVACSPEVERVVRAKRYAPARVELIENGIVLEGRPRSSLSGQPPVIGAVGRLVEVKGHTHLVEAFGLLARRGVDARLALVGDGELMPALRAQAERLGVADRVRFTGNVTDVPERLARMDLFVLPSLSEALPLAALEAGAAGLPMVLTSGGGARVLVEEQGAGGWVVPSGDAGALADALAGFAALSIPERRALGEASHRLVMARYAIGGTLDRHERLYRELVSR